MLPENLNEYNIILASASPRRRLLLKELGINFRSSNLHAIEESYPENLNKFEVPLYLSEKKSKAFPGELTENDILITADTIVWYEGEVINKPKNLEDAISILKRISGNMHEVITGVCLRTKTRSLSFCSHSEVYFTTLSHSEIEYYVYKYRPLDKAGAYGIQEWIGYIGIDEIRGSYYNVMGLPLQQLYRELEAFITTK